VRRWKALALAASTHGPRAALTAGLAKQRGAAQKLREFAGLVKLIRGQRPRTVLEIGTLRGGTLWAWCKVAARDATIISVDLPGGDFGGGYAGESAVRKLRGYARPGQGLHLLRADSHEPQTLGQVKKILAGRTVDFAFIDGDHTYAGVRQDFEMYSPLVSGLVAFHDTLPDNVFSRCEVDVLWRELKPRYETVEFTDPPDVCGSGVWGGIGVLRIHRPNALGEIVA
jgi:cephalosporin hydroxylase